MSRGYEQSLQCVVDRTGCVQLSDRGCRSRQRRRLDSLVNARHHGDTNGFAAHRGVRPATDHATAVDRYVFEVFPLGANTTVANPVATQDLGMPSITNGECRADIAATVFALVPGTYIATVTASGSGGSTQSAPSAQFTR